MKLRRLVLVPALALLASCDGSTGPTTITAFDGALSFTYTGGIAGSFSASGAQPTTSSAQMTQAWAVAQTTATSEMVLLAAVPRNSTSHDYVFFFLENGTVGTKNVNSSCSFNCTGMDVTFGVVNSNGSSFTQYCYLTSGSIVITDKTATRMTGTFSGTGTCTPPGGSPVTSFTVTNGVFDVAIIAPSSS